MNSPVGTFTCLGLLAVLSACAGGGDTAAGHARAPIIGGGEGAEGVFEGLPMQLTSAARIAPASEPGEPLRIAGTVFDASGAPAPGVIVYAYHTDARGIYPKDEAMEGQAAYRHGRLRAWVRSDADGRYRFDTIRPASYPSTTIPAHVHLHVLEPERCTYYIDGIEFADDPLLPEDARKANDGRGGSGIVTTVRGADGFALVTRDIHLGRNVPGYPER